MINKECFINENKLYILSKILIRVDDFGFVINCYKYSFTLDTKKVAEEKYGVLIEDLYVVIDRDIKTIKDLNDAEAVKYIQENFMAFMLIAIANEKSGERNNVYIKGKYNEDIKQGYPSFKDLASALNCKLPEGNIEIESPYTKTNKTMEVINLSDYNESSTENSAILNSSIEGFFKVFNKLPKNMLDKPLSEVAEFVENNKNMF